ncbi:uncharacterized protein RB166_019931 [Leptodactylus fuscus]
MHNKFTAIIKYDVLTNNSNDYGYNFEHKQYITYFFFHIERYHHFTGDYSSFYITIDNYNHYTVDYNFFYITIDTYNHYTGDYNSYYDHHHDYNYVAFHHQ